MRMKRDTQPFPQQRKCKEVGCKEVARRMAEKNPAGGGLWRMGK